MVGSTCFHKVCSLHADSIRHQRATDTICQQHPVPAFRHTKRLYLLCEPYPIRLLRPAPTAVSPTLDFHSSLFHRGEDAVSVNSNGGVLEVILARNSLSVSSIDVYGRHFCPIGQPIDMNADITSIRMLEILTIRFFRQNGIALPCNQIIDVLVEAQTGFLACLNLFIHINQHIVVWHFERRSQAFAYSSNRHKDCIFNHLAISRSEELVVEIIVELKRLERWEVWRLFAHRIHFRKVVSVSPIEIGFNKQLTIIFPIIRHILQRISFHSSVREIDMKGFRETRHYRRIWVWTWPRTRAWIVTFGEEEITFVPTISPTTSVSSKHV